MADLLEDLGIDVRESLSEKSLRASTIRAPCLGKDSNCATLNRRLIQRDQ